MSTPNPVPPSKPTFEVKLQALISLITSDALIDFGPALATFFAQTSAANGDPIKEGAALVQLHGAVVGEAPSALGGLQSQLATVVAAKVQAKGASAQTSQAAALATLAS